MRGDQQLVETFAELTRSWYLADPGVIAQQMTAAAAELVPGGEEAALCLLTRHGQIVPAAATSDPVAAADRLWHATDAGPCPVAIRDGGVHQVPDLLEDDRWPDVSRRAEQVSGLRCVLTLPIAAGTQMLGALTLAARSPRAFGPSSVTLGGALALHGALALSGAATRARNTELTEALRSNRLIGMALGIVMNQRRVTAQQAFEVLRRSSRHRHRKIHDLAAEIVETGEVPDGRA
ncbi:GAF and ANTAR domain-containing protein [Actinoplanes sp. L3-i22]|uniref:GAF and ANTAR domain-containing protein n=1 Tax=Actinoplanes sp. L3-i22 TaxID=2836373 RepID=UPI001C769609|nr:GAF and ANTAR domain-containing protein [Actinoplanes sp. L3-i22]BCY09465.1 hypothetical protein L3i22_045530 [Actinoplanes sp. L3-i22]